MDRNVAKACIVYVSFIERRHPNAECDTYTGRGAVWTVRHLCFDALKMIISGLELREGDTLL